MRGLEQRIEVSTITDCTCLTDLSLSKSTVYFIEIVAISLHGCFYNLNENMDNEKEAKILKMHLLSPNSR